MITANPEEELKVKSFMKKAWAIDGDVKFITNDEARDLLKTHKLDVIKLTDSERGTFYVGTFKEKSI